VSITDTLNAIWNQILEITTLFVIPDWGALIGLMPILIFLGVVGPLLTFTFLGAMGYQIAKPRTSVRFVEGPRLAIRDDAGEPVYPPGLPFCRRDALVYESGVMTCERSAGWRPSTPVPTAASSSRSRIVLSRSARPPAPGPAARRSRSRNRSDRASVPASDARWLNSPAPCSRSACCSWPSGSPRPSGTR
jgi:hypothetical protein